MSVFTPYRDYSPSSSTSSSPVVSSSVDEEKAIIKLEALAAKQIFDEESTNDRYQNLLDSKEIIPTPLEYTTSTTTKFAYLGLYFILNIALTLSNKHLLVNVSAPWLLTSLHATATTLGTFILYASGKLTLTPLSRQEHLILIAFSSLFTLNIAASNVSLALVSIPFHQIVRSTCPAVTVLLYRFIFGRTYSYQTYASMIPLIAGVGLTTYGDFSFTLVGFIITLVSVVTAATKSIATNRLMTGSLKLDPLELLARMSPLAAIQCLLYSTASGEFSKIDAFMNSPGFGMSFIIAGAGNAFMAFLLNAASFQTNKLVGALTMSICGNVKQMITIALGLVLFNVRLTLLNGLGMALASVGVVIYSLVELRSSI